MRNEQASKDLTSMLSAITSKLSEQDDTVKRLVDCLYDLEDGTMIDRHKKVYRAWREQLRSQVATMGGNLSTTKIYRLRRWLEADVNAVLLKSEEQGA